MTGDRDGDRDEKSSTGARNEHARARAQDGHMPAPKGIIRAGDGGVAAGANRSILALLNLGQSDCLLRKPRARTLGRNGR